ncbi:MAG: peptidase M14 [Flavobacteriaceae bacterium]|nr:peptidase M14 [Flavobacteriaceae bacterium]
MISKERYLSPEKWGFILNKLSFQLQTSVIGQSVLKQPITAHRIGNGPIKVLIWSQMHGNESTTTRALFDLIKHLHSSDGNSLLENLSLMVIPQLNPDGASAYTRLNGNDIDLNRDAIALSQPESIALKKVFDAFTPDFCFNLHGQRSIFSAGKKGKPATLSFLSPAADKALTVTPARTKAMKLISSVAGALQSDLPNQMGRYDDTFNPNCVGDSFTAHGVPTVLFEAGHYGMDYDRNFTKEMVFKALMSSLIGISSEKYLESSVEDYQAIPENEEDYVDLIIKNVTIETDAGIFKNQELAVIYQEAMKEKSVGFTPTCFAFAEKINLLAHKTVRVHEVMNKNSIKFSPGKSINIF